MLNIKKISGLLFALLIFCNFEQAKAFKVPMIPLQIHGLAPDMKTLQDILESSEFQCEALAQMKAIAAFFSLIFPIRGLILNCAYKDYLLNPAKPTYFIPNAVMLYFLLPIILRHKDAAGNLHRLWKPFNQKPDLKNGNFNLYFKSATIDPRCGFRTFIEMFIWFQIWSKVVFRGELKAKIEDAASQKMLEEELALQKARTSAVRADLRAHHLLTPIQIKERCSCKEVVYTEQEDKIFKYFCHRINNNEQFLFGGAILCGPPGTGKSFMVRNVAVATNCMTLSITPDFFLQNKTDNNLSIEGLFDFLQAFSLRGENIILNLEELELLFKKKTDISDAGHNALVSKFLVWMEKIIALKHVYVISTTNYLDSMDFAALRPGRFGLHININPIEGSTGCITVLKHFINKVTAFEVSESEVAEIIKDVKGDSNKEFTFTKSQIVESFRELLTSSRYFEGDGVSLIDLKEKEEAEQAKRLKDGPTSSLIKDYIKDVFNELRREIKNTLKDEVMQTTWFKGFADKKRLKDKADFFDLYESFVDQESWPQFRTNLVTMLKTFLHEPDHNNALHVGLLQDPSAAKTTD